MKYVTVVTGASSGFGRMAANALAEAGHTVYASMRETTGRNAPQVQEVKNYAREHGIDLRAIELDVSSQESTDLAIASPHWSQQTPTPRPLRRRLFEWWTRRLANVPTACMSIPRRTGLRLCTASATECALNSCDALVLRTH
jgi:hypothetical protein